MQATRNSIVALWIGRILTGLASLFLLFDAYGKIAKVTQVMEASQQLGYPAGSLQGTGICLLTCTLLYLFPRTAVLGAVLLTGYLGGAVASHVRLSNPWLTHVLFPCYIGVLVWGGLFLRNPRVAALIPWVRKS